MTEAYFNMSAGEQLAMYSGLEYGQFFDRVSGITVLQRWPGFREFYNDSIRPYLLSHPENGMTLAVTGASGSGKEILGRMAKRLINEDKELKGELAKQGYRLMVRFTSFGDHFDICQQIPLVNSQTGEQLQHPETGRSTYLIDPQKTPGELSRAEINRWVALLRHTVLTERPRVRHAVASVRRSPPRYSQVLITEFIGLPKPWRKRRHNRVVSYIDMGWGLLKGLSPFENTRIMVVVSDSAVQTRAADFREKVGSASLEDRIRLARRYRQVVEQAVLEDPNFSHKMGNRRTIGFTNLLLDMGIFDLWLSGTDILRGYRPRDFSELLQKFKEFPSSRTQAISEYASYVLEEVLKMPRGRFLVSPNSYYGGNIDLHRQVEEDYPVKISTLPRRVDIEKGRIIGLRVNL